MRTATTGLLAALASPSRLLMIAAPILATAAALVGEEKHSPAAPRSEPIRYGRDIRPIFSEKCFKCHGADGAAREADLRLDESASATAAREGRAAIVPGKISESELWRRICSDDPEYQMPPPKSQKPRLTAEEREKMKQWIDGGAAYEPHWAFVAPKRPAVPEVQNNKWPRNPIDRFILAKLEAKGLAPSGEADKATLLRRLFLDLTGLPPTVEELDQFLKDTDPNAYEKWVDVIFEKEPYKSRLAERLAAPWLDQARFADTCGIHTDAGRQIWPWRDWVLNAYRNNKPFDTFVVEQLAGDLLPNATLDQKVASGFNRNHVTSDEGGAIAEEYLVEYAVDRVATTGSVFLGLTFGCARCHDHKFEPISQKEFYQLFAFFDSIEEPGLYSQLPNSVRAFEPFLEVPTEEQAAKRLSLTSSLTKARADLDTPIPAEEEQRTEFIKNALRDAEVDWIRPKLLKAESAGGAKFTILPDGSALASGANPKVDDHIFTLKTDATNLSMLCIDALTDPSFANGRVGRAENGNAVLTSVVVEASSVVDPQTKVNIPFEWAFADHEQLNGDFRAVNVIDAAREGWAVQGHEREGNRSLLLLSQKPFGFPGGTEVKITLRYQSVYERHVLGRVRFALSKFNDAGRARLPVAASDWYLVGPFPSNERSAIYDKKFGPEAETKIDLTKNFGAGNQYWRHQIDLRDGMTHELAGGVNVHYLGRRLFSPSDRKLQLSLGSDDGVRVYCNGKEVFGKNADRPVAPDQDKAEIELVKGMNTVILKIVNTGGQAGFYYKPIPDAPVLAGDLAGIVFPADTTLPDMKDRASRVWRLRFSPGYLQKTEEIASLEKQLSKLQNEIPLTMVMKELEKPRETFVLTRGVYNMPDKKRPVGRAIPAVLGALPAGAPADRLSLAKWLVSPENPLLSRVAVNRFFEMIFGVGIVKSSENFGYQGEWPSHPELLDWLAVEFREGGWNVRSMLTLLVTSAAYRQNSQIRRDAAELDPENRLLAYYPRQRLYAEQIRDAALYISGLYTEKFGGPSVKPYQPAGLWEEVAMPASNTRVFERDKGAALYRRSIYTYWKRACPPPSLMTLDAPTREFCIIRRSSTNTPLQALVLWNDEQFVETARATGQRILKLKNKDGGELDDSEKLIYLFRSCSGRAPREEELSLLTATLTSLRERYQKSPEDAAKILKVGESMADASLNVSELAAWTMISNAVFSLDASICKN